MATPISIPFAATTAILAGGILLNGLASRRTPEPLARPLDRIASEISGWTMVQDNKLPAPTLHALQPTAYLARTYRKDNEILDLFISYYAQQRAGESLHSPKHCLPGAGWEIWKHDSASIPVNGRAIEVNKYSIQNSGSRMLMYYWYQSGSRIIASEYMGKLLLARDTLFTGRTAAAIVRISVADQPEADAEARAFAARVIPEVHRCFGAD